MLSAKDIPVETNDKTTTEHTQASSLMIIIV